jgi:deoxyribodipyrimidine photolyase
MLPFCCLSAVLLAALAHLRKELRGAGSDLVVRVGPAPITTAAIAGAAGVKRIVIERQEESR